MPSFFCDQYLAIIKEGRHMHYIKEVEVNGSGVTVNHWRILGYEVDAVASRGVAHVGGFVNPDRAPLVRLALVFEAPERFGLVDLYHTLGSMTNPQAGQMGGDSDPPLAGGTVVLDAEAGGE